MGIWVFTVAKWYVQMRQYRMRVLLFVTWQKLGECIDQIDIFDKSCFIYYTKDRKKNLLQRVTYVSPNSECSKWPIRTFTECILKETRNATNSNVNVCVFSRRFLNYFFKCPTYSQYRELGSENVTWNDRFNSEYEKKKQHKKHKIRR